MDIQKKYLIGVDVGTTSQKVAVFDTDGNTLAAVNVDYVLETRGNTVEFDALEYISILRRGLTAAVEGVSRSGRGGAARACGCHLDRYTR